MSLRLPYNSKNQTIFNLTLNERYSGTLTTGLTYEFKLINEQSSKEYTTDLSDLSLYPDIFNTFVLATDLTGGTTSTNLPIAEKGWYKYEIYYDSTKLEFGMCYVYGDIDTDEYNIDKDKYVYNR